MSDAKWEAGTLRVSLFTAEPIEPSLNAWADLFGEAPDQEETRPKDGFKRQVGVWRSLQAEININPQRVDVFLGPAPVSPLPGQSIAIQVGIGPFEEAVKIFAAIMQPWLKTLKFSVQRVGFGGQAMAEAANREDAYKILSDYVKSITIDVENMRDFFYRVNWRIGSDAVGHFNRLTTWSAPMVTFQLAEHPGEASPILNQRQFAQFEFDMNTPFEHQRGLEPDTLNAIFTQLVALALEVAADGEPAAKP